MKSTLVIVCVAVILEGASFARAAPQDSAEESETAIGQSSRNEEFGKRLTSNKQISQPIDGSAAKKGNIPAVERESSSEVVGRSAGSVSGANKKYNQNHGSKQGGNHGGYKHQKGNSDNNEAHEEPKESYQGQNKRNEGGRNYRGGREYSKRN